MEPDSIFRFVAVRPPTLKLPDPGQPHSEDPRAGQATQLHLAQARAVHAEEAQARHAAAEAIRTQDSLLASPAGQALLDLTAAARRLYGKLPRRNWSAALRTGLGELLAGLPADDDAAESGTPRWKSLGLPTWMTYYAGLLDSEREPYFEAARFWLRLFHVLDRASGASPSDTLPSLDAIALIVRSDLLVAGTLPAQGMKDGADRKPFADAAEPDSDPVVEMAQHLEALVRQLQRLRASRLADIHALAIRPSPARTHSDDLAITAVALELPRPSAPAGENLEANDRALLIDIGLQPDAMPLSQLIDALNKHLAQQAARLSRPGWRTERRGRIYVQQQSAPIDKV